MVLLYYGKRKQLIRFDWAIKKLLRNKANFDILEGFLSELLGDNIKIRQILDSESNKETEDDTLNPFGKKNVESIRFPVIRKIASKKIFFTKFYLIKITISTQTKKYILVGDIPLHELIPWIKDWKSKFN